MCSAVAQRVSCIVPRLFGSKCTNHLANESNRTGNEGQLVFGLVETFPREMTFLKYSWLAHLEQQPSSVPPCHVLLLTHQAQQLSLSTLFLSTKEQPVVQGSTVNHPKPLLRTPPFEGLRHHRACATRGQRHPSPSRLHLHPGCRDRWAFSHRIGGQVGAVEPSAVDPVQYVVRQKKMVRMTRRG